MPRGKTLALAVTAVAAATVACVSLGSLSRPVFAMTEGDSLCNSTVALEAHREVWGESGCELGSSGWKHLRDATEEQELRIIIAFADLPDAGDPCPNLPDGGAPTDTGLQLQLLQSAAESRWTVCGEEDGGIAPPFAEAVSAMRELGPPPP
ncbi:MAG TPA: hypothetical protein VFA20_32240 [Myxococcaceae bacterium]|nr:hypothetical protein [Myxococcaceae bacterium]